MGGRRPLRGQARARARSWSRACVRYAHRRTYARHGQHARAHARHDDHAHAPAQAWSA